MHVSKPVFSCFFGCFLLLSRQLPAQETDHLNSLSIKANYGIDVGNGSTNRFKNYIYGLHVSYDKNVEYSTHRWINYFNVKNVSFGLLWHNMNHVFEIIDGKTYPAGQAIGVLAELDIQLIRIGKSRIYITPGLGGTFITENIFTQPQTSTIGSHFNFSITGELSAEMPLSSKTSLAAGVNIAHYSNGAIVVPNEGFNGLVGSLGIKTKLDKPQNIKSEPENYHHLERNSIEFWLGTGVRGQYREKTAKFWRSGAYAGYNFFVNRALSLKSGMHMVYYHSVFDPTDFDKTFQNYGSSYDRVRLGVAVGADFTMGRLVVTGMYGKYLHYNSYHNIKWYWTYGLRYYLTPHFGLQTTHNLHMVYADYINWGLIFRI
ncbi:acyloxyacyl hydrolase [Olivibacter sitiensis]|uniref:acyloxyacyl hydrolase n=1 Tax=Olivibacter sitiensis TaxID=376470 RepID=UPI00041585C2|nr:acyloxyacyl hydrolase [Olivibacter sitiensis]